MGLCLMSFDVHQMFFSASLSPIFFVSSYVGVSQGGNSTCRIRIRGQKWWETGSRGEKTGTTKISVLKNILFVILNFVFFGRRKASGVFNFFGFVWFHLMLVWFPSLLLWFHLIFSDFLWFHLISFDFIWLHVIAFGFLWFYLITFDCLWLHSISFDLIRFPLTF